MVNSQSPSTAKSNLLIIAQAVCEDDVEQILRASTDQDGPHIQIPRISKVSYECIKACTKQLQYFYNMIQSLATTNSIPTNFSQFPIGVPWLMTTFLCQLF
jgi:hypothetical protein